MHRARSLLLAIAATSLAATPALATPQGEENSASVTYHDLDLSSAEGQAELDARIERAARQVCGLDERQTGSRIRNREARDCVEEAKRSFARALAGIIEVDQRGG